MRLCSIQRIRQGAAKEGYRIVAQGLPYSFTILISSIFGKKRKIQHDGKYFILWFNEEAGKIYQTELLSGLLCISLQGGRPQIHSKVHHFRASSSGSAAFR